MTSYPGAIPALGTLSGSDYPQISHVNNPFREIEAISTELGIDPKEIDDSLAPSSTPTSVAQYLSMVANAFKTLAGARKWTQASVPLRSFIYGNGGGQTVPASSTRYLNIFGTGLNATENLTQMPITYNGCTAVAVYYNILTAQPGDGELSAYVRKNNASNISGGMTVSAGYPAGIYTDEFGAFIFTINVNDVISIKLQNSSPTLPSAQIGGWAMQFLQVG